MSRLSHTDLHLTFRDFSSSESEDDDEYIPQNSEPDQQLHQETDSDYLDSTPENETAINNHVRNTTISSNLSSENNNRETREFIIASHSLNDNHDSVNNENEVDEGDNDDNDDDDDDDEDVHNIFSLRSTPRNNPFDTDHTNVNDNFYRDTVNEDLLVNENRSENSVNNSNTSTPPHLLDSSINVNDRNHLINYLIPRLFNNDDDYNSQNLDQSTFSGCSFFKNHPDHEFHYGIPNSMQKFGLVNLLNELLIHRNDYISSNATISNQESSIPTLESHKKRSFNQICLEDMNMSFLSDETKQNAIGFQRLTESSYLKSGSVYSLPTSFNGMSSNLKFTHVDYNDLSLSGFFQLGDVKLDFGGEIVDFLRNDLRYSKDRKFLIEGNVFSNLLRNKLIFSKKFKNIFDTKRRKCYTKKNWKPFSMNRMGYVVTNIVKGYPHVNQGKDERTIINPVKSTKFPNSSIFHKLQITNESKFDNFKLLSKWFDMPPLNQFINTPSPPTPPNRLTTRCTNNPENLLVCKDCVNLMISKFLFLKLEIDINDIFDNKDVKKSTSSLSSRHSLVFPDLVYKHRRRFHDYATNMISKSNNNFRRHIERQLRDFPSSSFPSIGSMLLNGSSDDESDADVDEDDDVDEDISDTRSGLGQNGEYYDNSDSYFNYRDCVDFHGINENDFTTNDNDEDDEEGDEGNMDSRYNNQTYSSSDDDRNVSNFHRTARSRMMDVWPLSAERFEEPHPILDPDVTTSNEGDNSDDDFDHPYNIIFTNDRSRRVSRLLFNINMAREQHRHRRNPISSLSLYKNGNSRMKMVILACINRNTGELHLVPGNLDMNMWSNEQNNGELFKDIETFSKVFKLFMDDEESKHMNDNAYTKYLKQWIKDHRLDEATEIKKLLMLQLLTNPSIVNGYDKRRESFEKKKENNNNVGENSEIKRKPSMKKKGELQTGLRKKGKTTSGTGFKSEMGNSNDHYFDTDIMEQLMSFMGQNNAEFDVDKDKALTFKPGLSNGTHNKQGQGSLLSFEFA